MENNFDVFDVSPAVYSFIAVQLSVLNFCIVNMTVNHANAMPHYCPYEP
jgi:hypothetical protein